MPLKLLRYTDKDVQQITMEEWLQTKPPVLRPVVVKWFNQIKNCGTDVQCIFHDYCPTACVDNVPFAYVNAFKAHINVGFFYGAYLQDATKILMGNGKRMRHIKIVPSAPIDDDAIKQIIRFAYADLKLRLGR